MATPFLLEEIPYKVANEYAYRGDLIITQGIIYYYMHTDLLTEKLEKQKSSMVLEAKSQQAPKFKKSGLWQEGISDKRLQLNLDSHIEQIKEKRKLEKFSSGVPAPLRITPSDIKQKSLSFMGVLVLATSYEEHIFDIGFLKKSASREALIKAGFF